MSELFRKTGIPKNWDTTKLAGAAPTFGTYLGVVKGNIDPTRSGKLKVWIPEFGAKNSENEPSHWIEVEYASPYMGASRWSKVKEPTTRNEFKTVNHTYGMWAVPPDIGNYVLVTFVGGNINRGYWFACIIPELGHYAVPGQAGSDYLESPTDADLAACLTNPPYPCVEFNEEDISKDWRNFLQLKKPVHEEQAKILLRQGLEDDKTRGVVSSSSQRESPSSVFGISTPGRASPEKDKDTGAPLYRLGGHTFVMDDGDVEGFDRLIRLRSSGGHQILMNDDEEVLYIANSTGDVWMEFSSDGKFQVYSKSDINFRTEGNMNFHADQDINFCAMGKKGSGGNINMFAAKSIREESAGTFSMRAAETMKISAKPIEIMSKSTLSIQATTTGSFGTGNELVFGSGVIYINQKSIEPISEVAAMTINKYADTEPTKAAPYYKYRPTAKVSSTIPTPIPTHEPWEFEHPTAATQATGSSGAQPTDLSMPTTPNSGDSAGPAAAQGKGVSKPASAADLASQPKNTTGVGSLTAEETTALKAQIAKSESGGNYAAENQLGYIGKYQFGAAALIDQGYVKPGTTNKGLSDPSNWTGKDGLNSKQDFWAAKDVQESIMDKNLAANYKTLIKLGAIDSSSPTDDVAGKLSVSHLLGAGGCAKWNKGQGGQDANGTTGDTYYNRGRYAIVVLSKTSTA